MLPNNLPEASAQLPLSKTAAGNPPKSTPKTIAIDWLSVSCKRQKEPEEVWNRVTHEYGTKVFKVVEDWSLNGVPIFVAASVPRSNILPPETVLVKFENHFLYTPNFLGSFMDILHSAGLEPRRINRLDIALDFVKFDFNLRPLLFLERFGQNRYIDAKHHKYFEIGQTGRKKTPETLRFGARTAKVSTYLYNKSQEFRDKGNKIAIEHFWIANGLGMENEIWRLEVSFKGNLTEIFNKMTGEVWTIDLYTIQDWEFLKLMVMAAMNRHFSFLDTFTHHRKDRTKPVILFADLTTFEHKTQRVTYTKDTTRSHKTALKKLVEHAQELKEQENDLFAITIKIIEDYAGAHNLINYLMDKTAWAQLNDL